MASSVQQYIDAVAQLRACGENSLVSLILFGSAASGAFSESSDVDLILVLPNEAALEDRRRLREAVSAPRSHARPSSAGEPSKKPARNVC